MKRGICILVFLVCFGIVFSQNITFDKKRALHLNYSKDSIVDVYKGKLVEKYKSRVVIYDYAKINFVNGENSDRIISYEIMTNSEYQPMYIDIITLQNNIVNVVYTVTTPVYGDGIDDVQQVGVDWIDNGILIVDYYFQNSNQDYECIKSFYFKRDLDEFMLFRLDTDLVNYSGHKFYSKIYNKNDIYLTNYVLKLFPELTKIMLKFDIRNKH